MSIGNAPNLFNPLELFIAMTRHIMNGGSGRCKCGSIPSQTVHEFWEALESVVNGSFEKVNGMIWQELLLMILNILKAESCLSLCAGTRGSSSPNQFDYVPA